MYFNRTDEFDSIEAATYALRVTADKIHVRLCGEDIAVLDPRSSVNTVGKGDDTNKDAEKGELSLAKSKEKDCYVYTWSSSSSLWTKKEYVLKCFDTHFEYFIRLSGKGDVDSVNYFSGDISSPWHGSHYEFAEGYAPIATIDDREKYYFSSAYSFVRFSYLMVPPMFCYAFRTEDIAPWLALGLAAKPGEHQFVQFDYHTNNNKFYLSTDNAGHTKINGTWESPKIIGYSAEDEFACMRKYADYYFDNGLAQKKLPQAPNQVPRFWHGPMFCGWIEQGVLAAKEGGSCFDHACEKSYKKIQKLIEEQQLKPTIMIIDDKWQKEYGTLEVDPNKWTDLRGFVDEQKAKGIHVLLWFKMWDSEGLPEDMCVKGVAPVPVMANSANRPMTDPTNPKYREFLKKAIYHLLSSDEGCCNADGFKLDFAFFQPTGRAIQSYDGKYGVELFHELVSYIYQCAKEAKPEAIINCSPCHPYFAHVCDQARLHDYDGHWRNNFECMQHRQKLYAMAIPNTLVDTDGSGFYSRRDTLRYIRRCTELGIPDLYEISDNVNLTFTEEERAEIRNSWENYSAKIDAMYK